jgi:sulfatase modifying factor 1
MPPLPPLSRRTLALWVSALVVGMIAFAYWPVASPPTSTGDHVDTLLAIDRPRVAGMIFIEHGTFTMGSSVGPVDCRPAHSVKLSGFWIDEHEVTNEQFARFIHDTGYLTTAEQVGRSSVYNDKLRKLTDVAGADWQMPVGPGSTIIGRDSDPVVHVSWHDAQAYARWAGKKLPSEAQWERAARGSRYDSDFPWGRSERIAKQHQANTWQGAYQNTATDGFARVSPVGNYPANAMGLYDVAGNVREWCADAYADDYYRGSPPIDPPGPRLSPWKVVRGGSWRSCAFNGAAHRVWVRRRGRPEQTNDHTGFRCVSEASERMASRP